MGDWMVKGFPFVSVVLEIEVSWAKDEAELLFFLSIS